MGSDEVTATDAELDALIGKKFPVLDHGHVILLDYMGCDDDIAQAARTSYQKGTRSVSDNRALLRYLVRNHHTTPLEMAQFKFHVKLPIFVERQWIRHRMFSTNEVSARYSELPEEYYLPEPASVCQQSKSNKQGRDVPIEAGIADNFIENTEQSCKNSFAAYHSALNDGVARELSRISLPVGTYTEKVWSGDLKNLLDFLALRMDAHAQWEIQQYAKTIGYCIVSKLFPLVWEAFCDFRVGGMRLSTLDIRQIVLAASLGVQMSEETFDQVAIPEWKDQPKNSERKEFLDKIRRLGLLQKKPENA